MLLKSWIKSKWLHKGPNPVMQSDNPVTIKQARHVITQNEKGCSYLEI